MATSESEICTSSSFSFRSAITQQRHDVFLSFRGEDTRHGLTKELHNALSEAGIPTFKDDINLEKGSEIASELLKAIQMSRVAVIVFSRNYATSGWCLDELVKIVECKQLDGQFLVPVFCDVTPQDVYEQKGSFAEAFVKHEERFGSDSGLENKIGKWRAALKEASGSSFGWDLQNNASQWHISKFINEIVNQISCRRQDAHMSLHLQPQTDDDGKLYLNHLLSVISDDVLVIGIYGADKLSKTSIAKYVYNQNFLRFEGSSFLANVSEISKQPDGLVQLQEQLLYDILMDHDDDLKIEDVNGGIGMIQTALQSRRVLVVLDDMDKLDQLNALARKRAWFGAGSRIIITTGDANLLSTLESDDVYGPQGIQIIKEKYRKNLKMIEHLEGVLQKSVVKAQRKESILIAEIERERRKNVIQAQLIAELERGQDQVHHSVALTKTKDVVLYETAGHDCIVGTSYETILDSELENKTANEEKQISGIILRGKFGIAFGGTKSPLHITHCE